MPSDILLAALVVTAEVTQDHLQSCSIVTRICNGCALTPHDDAIGADEIELGDHPVFFLQGEGGS